MSGQFNLSKHMPILLTIGIMLGLAIKWWPTDAPGFIVKPSQVTADAPLYHEQFLTFGETPAVHAPSLTAREDGKLIAAWYAGTREGAKDVRIDSTIIDPVSHTISPALPIASRLQTQADTWRYIRKLGNPVIHQLRDGRLMLVYVSVSFGGWAASNLNVRFSDNGGLSWGPAKRLVTSPFLNISTLVKGTPFNLENGNIAIPVYHEFMGKFAEMLVIDPHGKVVSKHRISWGRDAIQPMIVPLNKTMAVALLRDSGEVHKRIGFSKTADSGHNWSIPEPLQLPNPNAAVSAVRTPDNATLMVFNNHTDERNDLTLAISRDDGDNWQVIRRLEYLPLEDRKRVQYSYPYLISDDRGNYHLLYTWHKERIKYVHFNQAWLEQQQ